MAPYDIIGNVALAKFSREEKLKDKKKFAEKFLKEHKNVKTVLEKSDKIKGRLRTPTTRFLAGDKTKEVLHRENGCEFRFNVDTCYFSPRLSSERKDIALQVKKNEDVLVMFSGVGPFGIVISKLSRAGKIVCVELGKECNKYAKENVKRNKAKNVEVVGGDVRRAKLSGKYDRIIMTRPNLKDSFLDVGFKAVKKGGIIHYYGFYSEEDKDKLIILIQSEAKKVRKRVKILRIKKAGEIGPYKFRLRVDLKVD